MAKRKLFEPQKVAVKPRRLKLKKPSRDSSISSDLQRKYGSRALKRQIGAGGQTRGLERLGLNRDNVSGKEKDGFFRAGAP